VTMTSFRKIREAVAAVGVPLSAAEADMLRRYAEVMGDRYCRFCATCEATCPHGVAVADVNRYAMYFSYYGREREALGRYAALPGARSAAACAGCDGRCDAACPFGRQVRAELVAAHARLCFAEA
jgi:predicted aldo/keto reductase-like oxidoreductase